MIASLDSKHAVGIARTLILAGLCVAILLTPPAVEGAKTQDTGSASSLFDKELFEPLEFRNIGPFRGGRSTAVTGVLGDPLTFYMGTTGGGVWKTADGGGSWKNISDGHFAALRSAPGSGTLGPQRTLRRHRIGLPTRQHLTR